MAARVNISASILVAGLLASASAFAQKSDVLKPDVNQSDARAPKEPTLRLNEAMLLLDYQVVRVAGDEPIDLMGFHVITKVADGLFVGAGLYAPLFKGVYGGFTAFDISVHAQHRLTSRLFATAGLSLGGGAGGRSVENAKTLSGTGGFYKGSVGLGYDFGSLALGVNVSKMKFRRSAIDGTQANVFLQVPFTYLTGPFGSHGQRLSPADADEAAAASSERMVTVVFDNFRQLDPKGSYKGNFNVADLQFAQYFARDTYWYAGLGVGYRGLPLYNHVMGGVGQRVRLSQQLTLYGQLGIGSGGYAPERIDTDAGLLVYPRIAAEYALTKNLGLSLSAGYLVAPKGSSKNLSFGLGLTRHFRVGDGPGARDHDLGRSGSNEVSDKLSDNVGNITGLPTYQAFRVGLFQQTESPVRFIGIDRGQLQMIGIQADAIVSERWYIPLQASVAYTTYLGYPGYGELLAGIGVQSRAGSGDRLQAFGELMAGTNVHGLALKAGAGLRYGLSDRVALRLAAGRIEARSAAGNRFTANSLNLGVDYRFSLPAW